MQRKSLFGLYDEMSFVNDEGHRDTVHSVLVCASYKKEVLSNYAATLNAAEVIRRTIFPSNTINEVYVVKPIKFLDV